MKRFDLNKTWLLFFEVKLSAVYDSSFRILEEQRNAEHIFVVIAICIYGQGLGFVTIIITSQVQRILDLAFNNVKPKDWSFVLD